MERKDTNIDWQLGDIIDRLKGDWAVWEVTGEDQNGNKYSGTIQTFIYQPELNEAEIEDIEIL
jgi:hypothetical protein